MSFSARSLYYKCVYIIEVSVLERCPILRGVSIREVSILERCLY
jgi:hypothetical protein